MTPPSGRRERLARQLSVPATKRPLGAVTLTRGQFTFGCFQRLKAPCLEMRVLADLALSVQFKGLCNSLVWNRVRAWRRENTGAREYSFQLPCLWERKAASFPSSLHTAQEPKGYKQGGEDSGGEEHPRHGGPSLAWMQQCWEQISTLSPSALIFMAPLAFSSHFYR